MAEVKNAFIKSKMNLDLDARLVPQGEYRQGFNIQVSKSEGDDVGALENVLGNKLVVDFAVLTGENNLQIIGQYTSPVNNTIFIFLTNNTDLTFATQPSFNPLAQNYIYAYNTISGEVVNLVSGAFLNFSITNLITGVSLIENLLFWTDNRNQPRKININNTFGYYTNEDQISVAKYSPFQAINLYKNSTTQGLSGYESTMYDVTSPLLPDGVTLNPYFQGTYNPSAIPAVYNSTFAGDPDYLENKFVRFSYRFKFDDNEYSIIAPFTQACFIPQQDGYFLTTGGAATTTNEDDTFRSSIVRFMKNKVNEIILQIPLPLDSSNNVISGNNLSTKLKIKEIEILYAEDFSSTASVLDIIESENFGTGNVIEFTYQSTKPYKTIPENDLVRVYDKVPVRALSQEIIGNRVVYGNFQDKHTPPSSLNYNVGVSQKSNFNITNNTTSITEYPSSTVKQNRNYQVGIVLSDRYGRSSTTILSNNQEQNIFSNEAFDAATVYHNYRRSSETSNLPITTLKGDSIKVLFNEEITSSNLRGLGTPGLYEGNVSSVAYNPLGWYSYKIVVKQVEQEYYNVYTPGILNGPPNAVPSDDAVNQVAFVTLISDNINKVPKDLIDVGPDQKQFRSSVRLFGRVMPESSAAPSYNTPFYPNSTTLVGEFNSIIAIGTQNDLFNALSTEEIYDQGSNPFVTRISQIPTNPIGSLKISGTGAYSFKLGVFETSPFESLLDIYYETSTSGTISSLNSLILSGNQNLSTGLYGFNPVLTEAMQTGSVVIGEFAVQSALSAGAGDLPTTTSDLKILNVVNGAGTQVQTGDAGPIFTLESQTSAIIPNDPTLYKNYTLKTAKLFYFSENSDIEDRYIINFKNSNETIALEGTVPLQNIQPIIYKTTPAAADPDTTIALAVGDKTINANNINFNAVNGSADTNLLEGNNLPENKRSLQWSIVSATPNNFFTINPTTGIINVDQNADPSGLYNIQLKVRDATKEKILNIAVTFGEKVVNPGFGSTESSVVSNALLSSGGSSLAIYWTNNAANANQNEGLDRTIGEANNNALILPSTLGYTSEGYTNSSTSTLSTSNFRSYDISNTNYNAIGSAKGVLPQSDGGLTQGTGYITVSFNLQNDAFEDFNLSQPTSKEVFAMFPVILQYRAFGAGPDAWTTAVDIEGNSIQFGTTQSNLYSYYGGTNRPINDQSVLQYSGVLFNATRAEQYSSFGVQATSASNNNNNAQNSTCAQILLNSMSSSNTNALNSQMSKTFAIGESQSYGSSYNKFGDYRLIVRYPWGLDNTSGQSSNYIVPGYNQYPSDEWGTPSIFDYSIEWGDFYYPPSSSSSSYAYRVSPSGSSGPSIASSKTPTNTPELFAREWHLKYVSQFYTDAALTQPWSPGAYGTPWSASTAWYSFTPNTAGISSNTGTDVSNVSNFGSTAYQSTVTNVNRRWVAYFDANGKKVPGYAYPVEAGRNAPIQY